MTIKAITSQIKERRFAVYDLEWNPDTMVPRLFGFYDGERYVAFKSVEKFMSHILQDKYKGWWFFAHAGGIADLPFLLEWMVNHPSHQTTARFSGSAAVMVEVAKKKWCRSENRWKKAASWTFVDSFFLLRTKLRKIGDWIGEKKGGAEDSTDIFYAPWPILRDYNELDCTILYKALKAFADLLVVLGGEMMPTIASTAMRLFRRKYLGQTIRTLPQTNTELRSAYASSRVEVFKKQIWNANQYDLNSSFPFSMTKPVPGDLMGVSKHIPDGESLCWFANVKVNVPEMDIPPLPYRRGGKVFFPTGNLQGWMSGVDIRFLEERGGKVDSVSEVLVYDEWYDLAEYVSDLYERRRTGTTEFEKVIYKFLLNALYGKFGERTEKTTLILNPTHRNMLYKKYDDEGKCIRHAEELFPGGILVHEDKPIAHEHVPAAVHITAQSRALLGRGLYEAADQVGECPAYCDSITGDRTVVVRRPTGETEILPIEELWEMASRRSRRADGKEHGALSGWDALARNKSGVDGWFPVQAIIRHKTKKKTWRVSTKRGQTCVTSDHGIMVRVVDNDPSAIVAMTPSAFVAGKHRFESLRAAPSRHLDIDLWPVLSRFSDREFVLSEDGKWVSLKGLPGHNGSVKRPIGRVRRYYPSGSVESGALLRLVGAFVSEGSASIRGLTCARTCFTISQNDRKWLEALMRDLKRVGPSCRAHICNTGRGMWAIRSGSFLSVLFWALCGLGSRGRKLPPFCFDLGEEDFQSLWDKLVEGDGHVTAQGMRRYSTISQQLAAGLSYVLDQHGVEHSFSHARRQGRVRSCEVWTLCDRAPGSERLGGKMKVEIESPSEGKLVYDLSVKGAGTFVDGVGRVLAKNTDCVVTTAVLPTSDALGDWKLEREVKHGEFFAPKFYRIDGKIKAKGFSGISPDGFERLVQGYQGQYTRQARPREMLRSGDLKARQLLIPKQLRFAKENEKRVFSEDGLSSRPYTVEEINKRFPKGLRATLSGMHDKNRPTDRPPWPDESPTLVPCEACGGTNTTEKRESVSGGPGRFSVTLCRWCTNGGMSAEQRQRWRDRKLP